MAKDIKQFSVGITISGEVSPTLNKSVKQATSLLNKLDIKGQFQAMDKVYGKAFDSYWRGSLNAVKSVAKATVAVSGALIGVGAAATKAGMEYESAFAGVKKTVDATVEQFEILDKGIRDMSLRIPSSAVDIAGVMEVAGQLGITTDNLLAFTDTMIRLGVSTNLGADEAATSLAKFANITQMDPKNYEKLGSVIVDLGNNYATTEADIVSMATKMASTGDLLGLTEPQIMAVATAMSAVGIEAERGGSTMSKLLKKIQLAVETDPEQLKKYADVAGMSIADFSKLFGEDALAATSAFIEGIDDVERNGKSAVAILDDMGLNEIRLSNTILALAGGEDLLSGAIEMANKAWEENTALTKESEQRFGTTESKVQILKNSLTNLGIEGFYSIEGYVKDALDWASELIQKFTEYATGPNGIASWIDWLKDNIPKVISKVSKFAKVVLDFLQPLFDIGSWMIDHVDFLAKVFISLGVALTSYKIVSSMSKIVGYITTLCSSPVMMGVTALIGAVGLLTYYALDSKEAMQELVDIKIDDIFGNIALSIGEIEDVATMLVDNGQLDLLAEALKQFEDLDVIQDSISDAVGELNKLNWKVSIGLDISESDIESYKENIESFISNCEDYIVQQRYAVKLAVELVDPENSGVVGSEFRTQIDYFYNESYSQLKSLGEELSRVVTDAFADNLLDPSEINKIADIQGKMSEIQSKFASAEYEASLISLGREFDATSLTPESYEALQSAVSEKLEYMNSGYKEARDLALQSAILMRNEGAMSEDEFNSLVDSIWNSSLEQMASAETKAAEFLVDSVTKKTVGELYNDYYPSAQGLVEGSLDNELWKQERILNIPPYDSGGTLLYSELHEALVDVMGEDLTVTSEAAALITENLEPIKNMLSELVKNYTSRGIEIPSELADVMDKIDKLDLLSTDAEGFAQSLLYEAFGENDTAKSLLDNAIHNRFINKSTYGILPGHATGGIFDIPHIAAFAEDGPEAAIPINGTRSAKKLWLQTGQLLGMRGAFDDVEIGGGSPAINYAPSLNFYGGTPSQNDITSALRVSKEEFAAMMDRYMKEKSRIAF